MAAQGSHGEARGGRRQTHHVGSLPQEQRDLLDLLITAGELGRPYVISKTAPVERLAILRTSFDATVADKAFLTEAEKLRLPVNPATGAEAEKVIARIYGFSPARIAKAKDIIK